MIIKQTDDQANKAGFGMILCWLSKQYSPFGAAQRAAWGNLIQADLK